MIPLLTIYFLVIILLILIGVFHYAEGYDYSYSIIVLALSLCSILCYILNIRKYQDIKNKVLKPSILLLCGMCIIAFQNIIDLIIGNTGVDAEVFCYNSIITKGLAYGAIAIVAYVIGYIATSNSFSLLYSRERESWPIHFLVFAHACLSVLFIFSLNNDFFTGQAYIDSGDISQSHTNNSEVLLDIFSTAILIQYAINNKGRLSNFSQFIRNLPKLFLLFFSIYIILTLISGSRFPVLKNILLLTFSYIYCCRKQPFRNSFIIALLAIGSFIFTIVSFGRVLVTDDLSEKYTIGIEGFENRKSFSPTTLELANSQYCDMAAINIFEQTDTPHLYGAIQGRYLAVIMLPNRILQKIWPVSIEMQGSAYFLTAKEIGLDSEMGLGSTIQTDFYVDFGLIGMIICMILVGVLFKKIDLMLYSDRDKSYHLLAVLIAIYIGACALYLARSAFIPMLKIPIYAFLLLKLNKFLFNHSNSV